MSNFSDSKLKLICSDAWVAKAYGEYLADCASTQAKLIADISAAIADDTLDALVSEYEETASEMLSYIEKEVYKKLDEQGYADPTQYTWGDQVFDNTYIYLYEHEPDIGSWMTYYEAHLPGVDFSVDHGLQVLKQSPDKIVSQVTNVRQAFEDKANSILLSLKIDSLSDYTLNEGYVNIKTLIYNQVMRSSLSLPDSDFQLTVTDNLGVTKTITTSVDDVMEQLKTNFASCVAWSQGFAAIAKETAGSAIEFFDAQIHNVISDVNERFASSVAQVRAMIASTNANVKSFLSTATEFLGWSKVIDDTFTTVDETDVSQYTGASPLAAVNLKTAVGLVQATGRTILAAALGIWNVVSVIGAKVWDKIKPIAMAITDDPVDIAIQDKDDLSYAISNFKVNIPNGHARYSIAHTSETSYDYRNYFENYFEDHFSDWIAIETIFGEVNFRITDVEFTPGVDYLDFDYEMVFRPRCINVRSALDYGLLSIDRDNLKTAMFNSGSAAGWDSLQKWINNGEIYPEDNEDETYLFAGFRAAVMLLSSVLTGCGYIMNSECLSRYDWQFSHVYIRNSQINSSNELVNADSGPFTNEFLYIYTGGQAIPSTVNNLDFIKIGCGYHKTNNDEEIFKIFESSPESLTPTVNNLTSVEFALLPLIAMYAMQNYEKHFYPTEYIFLPYCKGTYDFSAGRYRIKTDAENANIAQVLATALIIIVVVASALLIGKAVMGIFKNRKLAKMNAWIGQQDNAMWSKNKKLSVFEQAKYTRWKHKIDKLSGASGGMLGSQSSSSLIQSGIKSIANSVMSKTDVVRTLATGTYCQTQLDETKNASVNANHIIRLIRGDVE